MYLCCGCRSLRSKPDSDEPELCNVGVSCDSYPMFSQCTGRQHRRSLAGGLCTRWRDGPIPSSVAATRAPRSYFKLLNIANSRSTILDAASNSTVLVPIQVS